MAITRKGDVYAVDLVLDTVDARRYYETGAILNTAYISDMTNSVTPNQSGKTIDLVSFSDTGSEYGVQDWNGSQLDSDKLSVTAATANIKMGAVNFGNDIQAIRLIKNHANPEEAMGSYVARKMAEHVLKAVYAEIDKETTRFKDVSGESTGELSLKAVIKQNRVLFGEKIASNTPLVINHSSVNYDLNIDTDVTKVIYEGNKDNPTEVPFLSVAGTRFLMSDLVTKSGSGSSTVYNSYALLPDAVKVYFKVVEEAFGDTVRSANTLDYNTVFPFEYAVAVSPGAVIPVGGWKSKSSLDAS